VLPPLPPAVAVLLLLAWLGLRALLVMATTADISPCGTAAHILAR
jgi:hypothetical protein